MPDIDIDFCERRRERGHRVRHAQVRPRERRADHHVRHHEGQGRGARRRPRARPALRRRGPHRQADPAGPRHDARTRRSPRTRCSRDMRDKDPQVSDVLDMAPAPRGHDAQRRGARRRRRDRARADHRLRAALQERPRRNHDPVGHEGGRARRPAEDGLPGPEHAHAHPRRARRDQARPTAIVLDIDTMPLDDPKTYQVFCDGQTYGIFQFESSGMRDLLRKAKPQRLDDLDRAERALPARAAQERHGRRLHRAQAGQDRGQVRPARRSSRFSRTPTASSPTRNR